MSQLVYLNDSHATISTLSIVVTDNYPVLRVTSQLIKDITDAIANLSAASPVDSVTFTPTSMTTLLVDTRQVVHTISDTTPNNPEYKTVFTNGTWLDSEIALLETLLQVILRLHEASPLTSLGYTTP